MNIDSLTAISPKLSYHHRMDIDDMLSRKLPLVVVRRSKYPFEEVVNKSGTFLSEDCVDGNVFNYSMNLLGGAFDENQHLCIRQTELGCKDWDALTMLSEQEMLHYSEKVEGYPIYYLVEELQGKPVPYSKTIEKEKEYKKIHDELYNKGCAVAIGTWSPAKKEVSFEGYMRVNHAPTMLNYWHVVLDIYEPGKDKDNPLRNGKGQWKEIIRGYVYIFLCAHYVKGTPEQYSIPEECYVKRM